MVLFSKEQLLSISDYLEAKYVNKEVTSVEDEASLFVSDDFIKEVLANLK